MTLSATQLAALSRLEFTTLPVAMAFLATPPAGLRRVSAADPASCGYWKKAAAGEAFYTTSDDHLGCPVGAHTHGVTMTPGQAAELGSMLGTMIELKYIRQEEVPAFPRRAEPLGVVAYAPLTAASFAPDLVIFRGTVRQIMLLSEAAWAAGVFDAGSLMGRPACTMVPQTTATATGVASVGCIGNRVYTGLGDNEMYLTLPGARLGAVLTALEPALDANRELEKFHRGRVRP